MSSRERFAFVDVAPVHAEGGPGMIGIVRDARSRRVVEKTGVHKTAAKARAAALKIAERHAMAPVSREEWYGPR